MNAQAAVTRSCIQRGSVSSGTCIGALHSRACQVHDAASEEVPSLRLTFTHAEPSKAFDRLPLKAETRTEAAAYVN